MMGAATAAAMAEAARGETLRHFRSDALLPDNKLAAGFDPVMSAEERDRHLEPGPDPSVASHAADLQWCQTLVLVYPTWWSGQPARACAR